MGDLIPSTATVAPLAQALDDAVEILRRAGKVRVVQSAVAASGPSLLQQCLELCAAAERRRPPPIRLVRHLPGVDAQWLLEALDVLPNVKLVRRLAPLAGNVIDAHDLIGAALRSARPIDISLACEMFGAALQVLYAACRLGGEHLVLHESLDWEFESKAKPARPVRECMGAFVPSELDLRSVLVVQHPLRSLRMLGRDAQLSSQSVDLPAVLAWLCELVSTPDGTLLMRAEDVVNNPRTQLERMADHLELPLLDRIEDHLDLPQTTGLVDSVLLPDLLEGCDADTAVRLRYEPDYLALCSKLGYDPSPKSSQPFSEPAGTAPSPSA